MGCVRADWISPLFLVALGAGLQEFWRLSSEPVKRCVCAFFFGGGGQVQASRALPAGTFQQ